MSFFYSVSFVASHCVVGAVANVSGVLLCVEVRWSKQPFRDRFHLKNACGPPQVDKHTSLKTKAEARKPQSKIQTVFSRGVANNMSEATYSKNHAPRLDNVFKAGTDCDAHDCKYV